MKLRMCCATLIAALFSAGVAMAHPVLMISIDGLRPADVLQAKARGLKLPNLEKFVADGSYATGVRNVLPTITYPDHTTLITGVWPIKHGITNNTTFDPYNKNMRGWYWYASDIRVPTLWDAVHAAGGKVASISWPVSVGATAIDYNIPEYWRAGNAEDLKLLAALSRPSGIGAMLKQASGVTVAAAFGEKPENDMAKAKLAAALITLKKPEFFTLHLASVDGEQHAFGPGTAQAHTAIETCDKAVGLLVAAARKAEPDVVIAVVSDHGFAAVHTKVNLIRAFMDTGLVTVDAKSHKITAWQAIPWNAGGTSEIMLANPQDAALKARVADLLKKLASDPKNGIDTFIDRKTADAMGAGAGPGFFVGFKPGYYAGSDIVSPLVETSETLKGTHGYFPTHREMRATFMISGPGIAAHKNLGDIDMRDIAPTLANILHVSLPEATGKPLPVAD